MRRGGSGSSAWRRGGPSFVLAKSSGEIVYETRIGIERGNRGFTAWLEGDRWVVLDSNWGPKTKCNARIVQIDSAQPRTIGGFEGPSVQAIAGTGDGGFVVLGTRYEEYTSTRELNAYDREGKHRWLVAEDFQSESAIFSPNDVAVTTDGKIVVIDTIRHSVQLFGNDGKYLCTVDLTKAFGKEPNYPSGIGADRDGGFIVLDFNGTPPIWRLRPDGQVLSKFDPKFPDGRKLSAHSTIKARPGWACVDDRRRFHRAAERRGRCGPGPRLAAGMRTIW